MNPFQSIHDYEEYIYTLKVHFPSINRSNVIIISRGKRTAFLQGNLTFEKGYRVTIKERLSFDNDQVVIEGYGYELWRFEEKIAWYDSQPHPDDLELKSTYPHHKHIPPNIKHHRIPAPNMHFDRPNLTNLIQEIEELLLKS
jgi:hypothetical protein